MLSSFSWLQFSIFILLGLAVYYGYVLVVYYGRELHRWITGRRNRLPGAIDQFEQAEAVEASAGEAVNNMQVVVADRSTEQTGSSPNGQQVSLFPIVSKEVEEDDIEKVANKAIGKVMAVLTAAKAGPITREEIEERFRSVLQGFGHLKDTPHQETINQIIERGCMHQFSLRFEAEVLRKLWD
jgi:hypothetical protein